MKKNTINWFIEKSKEIHRDKYDYSKSEYINYDTKLCIVCPEHGEFWQTPGNHLKGKGCPYCNGNAKKTTEQFIEESKKKYGDEFDYSKVVYKNNETKVCIIDRKTGIEYFQTPANHLQGFDCRVNCNITTEEFIKRAKLVHGDRYDYSKVNYINAKTKVCIICPEHGEFWQLPFNHLNGRGCAKCKNKSSLEKYVEYFLTKNNVKFEAQKKFSWLGKKSLDFFLPEYNLSIECQGRQHINKKESYFSENDLLLKRDSEKYDLVKKNGIKMVYIIPNYEKVTFEFYKDKTVIKLKDFEKMWDTVLSKSLVINQVIKKEDEK